jgi:small-conductance mechanosensitive channel
MTSPVQNDFPDEKHSARTANTLENPIDTRMLSPAEDREAASRLTDDLELLRAERLVSNQEHHHGGRPSKSKERSRTSESEDLFETATKAPPVPEAKAKKPTWLSKIKRTPRLIRYFLYMAPGAAVLLVPVLLGLKAFAPGATPVGGTGGVYLLWFGIWLEIVWCSLWASRMITSLIPHLMRFVAHLMGSSNSKKWRDIGYQLELHAALFLWLLAVLVSYQPILNNHRVPVPPEEAENVPDIPWIDAVNKVVIALFVLATLNFVEKILLVWIAESFHQRTYARRIEKNTADMACLTQLYQFSKQKISREDSIWQAAGQGLGSGARTPMQAIQQNARRALNTVGTVAKGLGDDFLGRKTYAANHPKRVVIELLRTSGSSYTLARIIYRSLVKPDRELVLLEDLEAAFPTKEEAEEAFAVFDKDLNGDISMEEFELVCNEIHLERKAIASSLKDLDSVIKKLDKVMLFIIFLIAIVVFISIISGSAAAGLASAGTSLLGLAWVLQATAQEFLQSIIFVFVKHPFDVGDRVTVYGNSGALGRGDDYYVMEVSLLYTEFKKMEGHVVQAPNSLLNTLFILNQRRSNMLADPIELKMRFGTPAHLIEELKERMLEFCQENKRDYQSKIITEVKTLDEVRSMTMNFIFFHKSSFQNELLRLQRHNKFASKLMEEMVSLGIQGPYRTEPGGSREYPMYWSSIAPPPQPTPDHYDNSGGAVPTLQSPLQPSLSNSTPLRRRAGSRAAASLDSEGLTDFQDVYESRKEHTSMSRLRSIREREREHVHDERDDAMSATSGSAINRVGSMQSNPPLTNVTSKNRWIHRGRSSSRTAADVV